MTDRKPHDTLPAPPPHEPPSRNIPRYDGSQQGGRIRINTVVERPPPPQMPGMEEFDVSFCNIFRNSNLLEQSVLIPIILKAKIPTTFIPDIKSFRFS